MILSPDYQQFTLDDEGRIASMGERMRLKLQAIPLPDLKGKSVLDVGCDAGFWCWLAAERGASDVLGLDRNRVMRGDVEPTDLIAQNQAVTQCYGLPCRFAKVDLGKQWHEFGQFDVVLCLSMYHHWYNNCGDHAPIWFWLWRHLKPDGVLIWEGPVDTSDPVVRKDVRPELQANYNKNVIVESYWPFFYWEGSNPALHEPTREVWRFSKFTVDAQFGRPATIISQHTGGATKAFEYADGRRMVEISTILGVRPIPGSLNLNATGFDWDWGYYRAQLLDVKDRRLSLDGEWAPRWCRFYPLTMNGVRAWAMRFEGEERMPLDYVELISDVRLMDHVEGGEVTLCR